MAPSPARTRINCTPLGNSVCAATRAYVPPLGATKTSTPCAPRSAPKPRALSMADPRGSRVPSSRTRTSCTPSSFLEVTRTWGTPLRLNATTPFGSQSATSPLSPSDPRGSRVPFPWMRISWMPSLLASPMPDAAMARPCGAPPRLNAATSNGRSSSREAPLYRFPTTLMVPLPCTRTRCTESPVSAATRACQWPPISNAATALG